MWGLALSFLGWVGLSPTPYIASAIGATDPAIKLFLSILMGYPLAIVYHKHIRQNPEWRNPYFIITGLDMAWYNFGPTLYHNMIPVVVIYLTSVFLGPGKINCIITFVFNMTYLLAGYIGTESEDYDITWTMPHCVLTLKLIALSFDLWDGEKMKNGKELSANNKKTALVNVPSFAEMVGFVYFPSCFLVGPIFSFKRYHDFITDKFPLDKNPAEYEGQAMTKMIQGLAYVIAHQVGVGVFNARYRQSAEFWEASIFSRHVYCGLWAHFVLYKYISCWLLTEASCIRFGLSYNGVKNSEDTWDGCNNIRLMRFETATKFHHYIESFNCNTNHFAAEYIYKRLKFLGNREASQFFTLLFLAVWHGTRSGYYVTFLNEFLIIFMEKELEPIISRTEIYHKVWDNTAGKYILYALLKLYTIVYMGWSLVPFDLKVYNKWMGVYASLYFSGFLLFIPWAFAYKPLLKYGIKALNIRRIEPKTE
uniref:Lysophospholipid acyltransferase 5 n=1 Tax=Plutella xylostella TaxID=51655 RepID=A0A1L8D692_PLUXY